MKAKFTGLMITCLLVSSGHQVHSQNLCACPVTCSGNVLVEDYNVPGSWTTALSGFSTGTMSVTGSTMYYNNVTGNGCNRMVRPLPATPVITNAGGWRAECSVTINSGNAPAHYVMAFTRLNTDPISTCSAPWNLIPNDGIWVTLQAPNTPLSGNCCTNPVDPNNLWGFYVQSRSGAMLGLSSFVNLPSGFLPSTYYIRLVVHNGNACLSVFSNAAFTSLIGSTTVPIISSTYNFVQHGVISWGSSYRKVNMRVDNLRVCDFLISCQFRTAHSSSNPSEEINSSDQISVTPNPSDGLFKVELAHSELISSLKIYDIVGRNIPFNSSKFDGGIEVNLSDQPKGIYFIEVTDMQNQTYKSKIIVQK